MKRTHLPLNALRVYDAAARHLSFTRAADELAVTPAAVGQQIRALEDHLGVVLFRRTSKGLELTGEGSAGLDALREGFLKFEDKRPLVSAFINLGEKDFLDFFDLLKSIPPRHASLFLYTDNYNEEYLLNRSFEQPGISVDVRDLSWRYPLI